MVNYSSTSPYALTRQTSWYLSNYKHRPVSAAVDDRVITISQHYEHRPDLLAYELYGNPEYWWVFMVRNMNVIRDPIWDFEAGKEIFVPSVDHLKAVVG